MIGERQTQRLPSVDLELHRLGVSLALSDPQALRETLEAHRRRVREILDRIFPELSERNLDLFVRRSPKLLRESVSRTMLETLATQFAHAIEASSSAERAFDNLERFIEGVGV